MTASCRQLPRQGTKLPTKNPEAPNFKGCEVSTLSQQHQPPLAAQWIGYSLDFGGTGD
jgi:hypothetical protein